MNAKLVNGILACVLLMSTISGAATINITLNHATMYQTVVGIGGVSNNATASQATALVNDCGLSVLRYDWCESVQVLGQSRTAIDAGCKRVIGSCWSPPANMKSNGSLNNGGSLLTSSYTAFVDFAVQKVKTFKQTTGFDLYALSVQNEPNFPEPYGSCVYTPDQLVTVTRMVGKRFKAEGLATKLFYNEDMYGSGGFMSFQRALLADTLKGDTSATNYVTAMAFHGLGSNGITPVAMSALGIQSAVRNASLRNMQVWMTEGGIDEGLGYARGMIAAFRYGVSLWAKYDLLGSSSAQFMNGDSKTLMYYTAKCVQKFVRPGSRVMQSISSDTAAFSCFATFYDSTAKALILCLGTEAAQTITLSGTSLPSTFQKWVANASINCVNQGNVASNATIDLPANSIITLYATGYSRPAVGVKNPSLSRSLEGDGNRIGNRKLYTINGQLLCPKTIRSSSRPSLLLVGQNGTVRSRSMIVVDRP